MGQGPHGVTRRYTPEYACTFVTIAWAAFGATAISAQEPPDTVIVGAPVPDTLAVTDTLGAETDSVSADTIFYNMPNVRGGPPPGFATGVWSWDRHAIMASGANTVAELVQEVPGVITLLGGDYGAPASMSAFGLGGGGYRVIRDGFEVSAIDGGVVNLQLVGLAGISRVRLDRSMAQMVIEMWSHEFTEGRPFSIVEAGTGDLDTNMFRGVYADPTAMFGSIGVGLERLDTRGRGPGTDEGGNRTGAWVRYQLHLEDRAGIGIDYRKASARTNVTDYTSDVARSDLMVKGAWSLREGSVFEGWVGRSTYEVDGVQAGGGLATDAVVGGSRRTWGTRFGADVGPLWTTASYQWFEGEAPSRKIDASAGLQSNRWGGVSGRFAGGTWGGTGTTSVGGRVWVTPFAGVGLFAAGEKGDFGSRLSPVADELRPPFVATEGIIPGEVVINDRTTLRTGGSLSRWGATISAASLYMKTDAVVPLGLELDAGALPQANVERIGLEGATVLPIPGFPGWTLEGSYQRWDEDAPYLPREIYQGAFEYHGLFKETGNLEVWASVGVRGHDPMNTFVSDDGSGSGGVVTVPFYQSWYGRVQVRVVTVRLYLGWENFTLRRRNQTYPDRLQPFARTFFGLRWDMWN